MSYVTVILKVSELIRFAISQQVTFLTHVKIKIKIKTEGSACNHSTYVSTIHTLLTSPS